MTFEEYFKNWIKTKIKTATGMELSAVNDSGYKIDEELKKDENGNRLFCLVHGGETTKSNVPNFDLNTEPFLVSLIFFEGLKSDVLTAVQAVSKNNNAVLNSATIGTDTVKFKAIFDNPIVSGNTFDMRRNNSSAKALLIQWSVTVSHSTNGLIEPHVFSLIVGSTTYAINYVARYERASSLTTDTYQAQGSSIQSVVKMAHINTVVLTIYKVTTDSFQTDILNKELNFDNVLFDATGVKLIVDGNTAGAIDILEWSVSETYENNTAAYSLTLKR